MTAEKFEHYRRGRRVQIIFVGNSVATMIRPASYEAAPKYARGRGAVSDFHTPARGAHGKSH